jgi:MarR-like DNA-binding transcriptional regulator SgrR of sgrS sRNA
MNYSSLGKVVPERTEQIRTVNRQRDFDRALAREFWRKSKTVPMSVAEIAEWFECSDNTMRHRLKRMQKGGKAWYEVDEGKTRGAWQVLVTEMPPSYHSELNLPEVF